MVIAPVGYQTPARVVLMHCVRAAASPGLTNDVLYDAARSGHTATAVPSILRDVPTGE